MAEEQLNKWMNKRKKIRNKLINRKLRGLKHEWIKSWFDKRKKYTNLSS